MNVTKYRAGSPANIFGNFFDNFFNRDFFEIFADEFSNQKPSVNISETENAFQIAVAAPGLKKEQFELNVVDDQLNISAKSESKVETEEKGAFTRREFNFTSFSRTFTLPDVVNKDEIDAKYENGILNITLPKLEEAKVDNTRVIEIA